MHNELISIIAPCFNVSETLERYLLSILNQSNKTIELIAVDDGSTDNTADILSKYIHIFAENKMTLRYIYQDNAGLGSAINTGLKYVTGDYLCWSDPDDFYMPESMEKRLSAFYEHPECAVVSSDAYVFNSKDLLHPVKCITEGLEHRYDPEQFEYLLREESHFCAGCHMVRMSDFDQVNPDREIYPARRGQNWQLLLPLYYRFNRYFLDEPLYAYIVYGNSMSAGDSTQEKELQRWAEHEEIIRQTLKRIPLTQEESEKYDRLITVRYATKRLYTAIDYRDKEMIKQQYHILQEYHADTDEIRALYKRNISIGGKVLYKLKDIIGR